MPVHAITGGGGGAVLHVDETGNRAGKPILFIHGLSQCNLAWLKQTRSELASEFRLVAVDIRGHGRSEMPRDGYGDPQLWAEDVRAVIAGLGLDRPILVGWSYGGVIMSDYLRVFGDDAIAGTQWVGAVSKLGEPLVKGGFLGEEFLALTPGLFSDSATESVAALRRFLRLCVHDEPSHEDAYLMLGYNAAVPPHVRHGLLARQVDNDDAIRATRKPVSLVHGEADRIVLPAMTRHLATLLPQATVSWYPGVGHMPFWEAPERFNRELRDFRNRA